MEIKDYIIGILFSLLVTSSLWLIYEIQPREKKITTSIDSSKTVSIDTTSPPDTSRTISPDTIRLVETKVDTTFRKPDSLCSQIRDYKTRVSDSLLTGVIETQVRGYLINQNFSYTPQYPLQIKVNTETRVTKTIIKRLKRKGYPSIGVYGSTNLKRISGIRFGIGWTFSNGNQINYSYDPVLKQHNLGFQYNLKNIFN